MLRRLIAKLAPFPDLWRSYGNAEWMVYDSGTFGRNIRIRASRSAGWTKSIGLGISYTRTSHGTTYRQPGTNESQSVIVFLGKYSFELVHYWKGMKRNVDKQTFEDYIRWQGRQVRRQD